MKGRITLRDIARKAGCHHSTVSMVLRRHPSIPPATADRILRLAEKMGYQPNPLLSAWMTDVRGRYSGNYKATLAFLDVDRESNPHLMEYFYGASHRADELGYKLSYFWLHEPGMTSRRMNHILNHSGIHGVVIGPIIPKSHISLTWSNLATVAIGHSLLRPQLNRVVHDQFRGMQTAIRAMSKLGYRRFGMMWNEGADERTNYNYTSLLARYQQTIPARDRVPIVYDEDDLPRWFARWRPDCVISFAYMINLFVKRVGSETAIVDLDLCQNSVKGSAGIDQRYERIGAIAVDTICSDLAVNRLGVPEEPLTILVEGSWVDGATLPKLPRAESVK